MPWEGRPSPGYPRSRVLQAAVRSAGYHTRRWWSCPVRPPPRRARRVGARSPSDGDRPIRVLWLSRGWAPGAPSACWSPAPGDATASALSVRAAYLLPAQGGARRGTGGRGRPGRPASGAARSSIPGGWRRCGGRWFADPVDIVHAHNPVMAVGARIVARSLPRRLRPRVVVTDHNVWHGYVPVTRWADGADQPPRRRPHHGVRGRPGLAAHPDPAPLAGGAPGHRGGAGAGAARPAGRGAGRAGAGAGHAGGRHGGQPATSRRPTPIC